MKHKPIIQIIAVASLFSTALSASAISMPLPQQASEQTISNGKFEAGNGTFLLNGEPFVVKAAELHYPRIPKAILGSKNKTMQGSWHEYDLSLHILEFP